MSLFSNGTVKTTKTYTEFVKIEYEFKEDMVQKIFDMAKVNFLKFLCLNSLIKYLVSKKKIEIELITNEKTLGFKILILILEPSTKPFDQIHICLESKNKICLNYGLFNSLTNNMVFLEEIGFGNIKTFDFDFVLPNNIIINTNTQKIKNNNESKLILFFIEIFTLIYFDFDTLRCLQLPQKNLLVFDLIKKLPQENILLDYYFEKTGTGNTFEEFKYCVNFFFNKVDDFLKKTLVSGVSKELSLSPIFYFETDKFCYFEINLFDNDYSVFGELVNQFKNENRGIFFRFEFEMGEKTITFLSNSGFSKKNLKETIGLSVNEITNKLYFYLYHL